MTALAVIFLVLLGLNLCTAIAKAAVPEGTDAYEGVDALNSLFAVAATLVAVALAIVVVA